MIKCKQAQSLINNYKKDSSPIKWIFNEKFYSDLYSFPEGFDNLIRKI